MALKLIYVNQRMIRRYKALMEARYMAIEDLKVDENIDFLIRHLEAVEESCAERVLRYFEHEAERKPKRTTSWRGSTAESCVMLS